MNEPLLLVLFCGVVILWLIIYLRSIGNKTQFCH